MVPTPLKPEFFVTRPTGAMIPLIALDELPHHVVVFEVSRTMTPFDIMGMTCVGHSERRHQTYDVQTTPQLAAGNAAPPKDALRAKYFLTRSSGNMVPLLALDEMPEHFVISGVAKVLSFFDITGMTCVGSGEARNRVHFVEDANNPPLSYFSQRAGLGNGSVASHDSNTGHASIVSEAVGSAVTLCDESPIPIELSVNTGMMNLRLTSSDDQPVNQPSLLDLPIQPMRAQVRETSPIPPSPAPTPTLDSTPQNQSNDSNRASPVPTRPGSTVTLADAAVTSRKSTIVQGVKTHCSYWMRHGECDYSQQGCLFLHEMPTDLPTLRSLGYRDIPRWYREKYGLGSYLAASGSGAAFSRSDLRSAASSGMHQNDNAQRLSGNWRAGAPSGRPNNMSPNTPRGPRNIYNPQAARNPRQNFRGNNYGQARLAHGPLRRNETLEERQQFETLQAISNYERVEALVRANKPHVNSIGAVNANDADISASDSVSQVGLRRRRSLASALTDIEAEIIRQNAAKQAKDDAQYKKVCETAEAKKAEEATQAAVVDNVTTTNNNAATNVKKVLENATSAPAPAPVRADKRSANNTNSSLGEQTGGRRGSNGTNRGGRRGGAGRGAPRTGGPSAGKKPAAKPATNGRGAK